MMITQYYPNPLFRKTGARHSQSGNGTMTYAAGNEHRFLILKSADDTGMQCALDLTGLPPAGTRMVFSISAFIPSGATGFKNNCLAIFGSTYEGWTEVARAGRDFGSHLGQTYEDTVEFTLPEHKDPLQLVFNSPLGLRPDGHARQPQAHDQGRLDPIPGHGGPAGVRVLGPHATAALTSPASEGRRA